MKKITSYILAATVLMLLFTNSVTAVVVQSENTGLSVSRILTIINTEREKIGLSKLYLNSHLMEVARAKTIDMKNRHYFDHYSKTGKGLKNFLIDNNYQYIYAGENLAINFHNNQNLVNAWMASPTHKKNILHPQFREAGIYFEYIELDDKKQLVTTFIFGRSF